MEPEEPTAPATNFPKSPTVESVLEGVPGFSDVFFGPQTRAYADRICMDRTRLRGTSGFYYVKASQVRRMDGDAPITDKPTLTPLHRRAHAGFALYGENIELVDRVDSTTRTMKAAWTYQEPIKIRGIALNMEEDAEADERGSKWVSRLQYDLPRLLCDELGFRPREGDVVFLPTLLETFYDVDTVEKIETRFGATGFYVGYKLSLTRNAHFVPSRKEPPQAPVPENPDAPVLPSEELK